MTSDQFEITSDRLVLRPWRRFDDDDFARMNADTEVMADLGGPLSRSQAVMERIGLERRSPLDFVHEYDGYGKWNGLVWAASSHRWHHTPG